MATLDNPFQTGELQETKMMPTTHEELDRFHHFARAKIDSGERDSSLQELLDLWQIENPTPEDLHNNVLAVSAALRDLESGDRGIPFDQHVREMRAKYGIADNQ